MGWNLPPGCTDKDIDDAANGPIEDHLDDRREAIWVERTLWEVETACEELIGKGYEAELREVIAKLHLPVEKHYRGET